MSEDAPNEDQFTPAKIPTHAIFGKVGKVRVLSYDRNGYFNVIDNHDVRRYVHRRNLTFLPDTP